VKDQKIQEFLRKLGESETSDNSEIVPHGQRRCPICGKFMVEEMTNFVIYDVCPEHGAWLDNGVLGKLLARTKAIERIEKRKAVEAERRANT
jgi:Zn-finger nucleic acid-binding protein